MRKSNVSWWCVGVTVLMALHNNGALARDISNEQNAVYHAREHYSDANEDYEAYTKDIQDMEKHIAKQQAKLKELQEKQSAALAERDRAKADLDAKEKILNEVWDQRNK